MQYLYVHPSHASAPLYSPVTFCEYAAGALHVVPSEMPKRGISDVDDDDDGRPTAHAGVEIDDLFEDFVEMYENMRGISSAKNLRILQTVLAEKREEVQQAIQTVQELMDKMQASVDRQVDAAEGRSDRAGKAPRLDDLPGATARGPGQAQDTGVTTTDTPQDAGTATTDTPQDAGAATTETPQDTGVTTTDTPQDAGAATTDTPQRPAGFQTWCQNRSSTDDDDMLLRVVDVDGHVGFTLHTAYPRMYLNAPQERGGAFMIRHVLQDDLKGQLYPATHYLHTVNGQEVYELGKTSDVMELLLGPEHSTVELGVSTEKDRVAPQALTVVATKRTEEPPEEGDEDEDDEDENEKEAGEQDNGYITSVTFQNLRGKIRGPGPGTGAVCRTSKSLEFSCSMYQDKALQLLDFLKMFGEWNEDGKTWTASERRAASISIKTENESYRMVDLVLTGRDDHMGVMVTAREESGEESEDDDMGDTEESVRLQSVWFGRLRTRTYAVSLQFTTQHNDKFDATANKEEEDNMRGFLARFGSFETNPNGGTMWRPRGASVNPSSFPVASHNVTKHVAIQESLQNIIERLHQIKNEMYKLEENNNVEPVHKIAWHVPFFDSKDTLHGFERMKTDANFHEMSSARLQECNDQYQWLAEYIKGGRRGLAQNGEQYTIVSGFNATLVEYLSKTATYRKGLRRKFLNIGRSVHAHNARWRFCEWENPDVKPRFMPNSSYVRSDAIMDRKMLDLFAEIANLFTLVQDFLDGTRVSGDDMEMRVAASNAFTDVYNWTVGNTAKLNKVWNHYRKFFVDYIKYLVQYCSQDNDTDILNELKKKEKRLYEFESVDSCKLTSIPGLKEATTEWKYNGWKEEFETNSQLSKFLNKHLVNISKLLTCKAYYQKCIAYQALQSSMQPMFKAFLKSGLQKIVEGVEKKLELRMDAFNVLDNFMRVWDGDLDDVMDEIEFCWDMNAETLQDILTEFDAKRESAPDNQFLIKITEYLGWLLEKEKEEQDDDHE